ncbi:hypothetical protein AGDE_14277 [Angomonas deanei]|nr:hypothetical protein AGDE_14277 [Angomonas deanei]|eukprot:EPY21115.1 hypothetical protein AGDE_14277 [Angomonas deanei]
MASRSSSKGKRKATPTQNNNVAKKKKKKSNANHTSTPDNRTVRVSRQNSVRSLNRVHSSFAMRHRSTMEDSHHSKLQKSLRQLEESEHTGRQALYREEDHTVRVSLLPLFTLWSGLQHTAATLADRERLLDKRLQEEAEGHLGQARRVDELEEANRALREENHWLLLKLKETANEAERNFRDRQQHKIWFQNKLAELESKSEAVVVNLQRIESDSEYTLVKLKKELNRKVDQYFSTVSASIKKPPPHTGEDATLDELERSVHAAEKELQKQRDRLTTLILDLNVRESVLFDPSLYPILHPHNTDSNDRQDQLSLPFQPTEKTYEEEYDRYYSQNNNSNHTNGMVRSIHSNYPLPFREKLRNIENKDQLLNLLDVVSFHEGVVATVGKVLYIIESNE